MPVCIEPLRSGWQELRQQWEMVYFTPPCDEQQDLARNRRKLKNRLAFIYLIQTYLLFFLMCWLKKERKHKSTRKPSVQVGYKMVRNVWISFSLDLVPEFADIDKTNPNCVVIGDAAENFSYANLNEAFRVLIGLEKPVLISLGKGWVEHCLFLPLVFLFFNFTQCLRT